MLRKFKQKIESLSLSPYADGRFEVSVDGRKIHSKLESKQFPEDDAILAEIEKLAGGTAASAG